MTKEEHIVLKWRVEDEKLALHTDIDCNLKHAAAVLIRLFRENPRLAEHFIEADSDGLSVLERRQS